MSDRPTNQRNRPKLPVGCCRSRQSPPGSRPARPYSPSSWLPPGAGWSRSTVPEPSRQPPRRPARKRQARNQISFHASFGRSPSIPSTGRDISTYQTVRASTRPNLEMLGRSGSGTGRLLNPARTKLAFERALDDRSGRCLQERRGGIGSLPWHRLVESGRLAPSSDRATDLRSPRRKPVPINPSRPFLAPSPLRRTPPHPGSSVHSPLSHRSSVNSAPSAASPPPCASSSSTARASA